MKHLDFCSHFAFVLWLAMGVASTTAAERFRILLTNDDGYDAPGITAVQKALMAAGHEVMIVAPLKKQSGASAKVTFRDAIGVKEEASGIWSVDGTPADCVSIGIRRLMAKTPPDLVVSGANFGQNLGADVNISGTVGAAIMATRLGTPAIAISVELKRGEATAKPQPFPSTHATFVPAGKFVVELIDRLEKSRAENKPLLPPTTLLNVNYPAAGNKVVKTKFARLSRLRGFKVEYVESDKPDELRPKIGFEAKVAAEPGTDRAFFDQGFVTISVLDGSLDQGAKGIEWIATRVNLESIEDEE